MTLMTLTSVSLILFSVIDIIGSLPVLISMRKQGIILNAPTATVTAGLLMMAFLFFGVTILNLFHLDVASFAMAGALIIFFIGLEMILGIRFFRHDHDDGGSGSIVPVAFPILAGAGTLTTIISLKTEFDTFSIVGGILLNLLLIYFILRNVDWLSHKLGNQLISTLRKVFGIILIAIAFQMFKDHLMA